jgi:ferrous iron transport protein B
MFNLFSPPCFAAIGAMNSEMKSAKWLWGGIGFQLGVGYTIGYLVYTVGTLVTAPATLALLPTVLGGVAVAAFVGIIAALCIRSSRKVSA